MPVTLRPSPHRDPKFPIPRISITHRRRRDEMTKRSGSSSSSEEEDDGDARWKERIRSVAVELNAFSGPPNGNSSKQGDLHHFGLHGDPRPNGAEQPRVPKLYEIKARKFLDDVVEKNLEFVQDSTVGNNDNSQVDDCGVRLFRKAPPGIVFERPDVYPRPTKRPQIIPREEIDEKSKKFRRQVRKAAVEGVDIMDSANGALQRSLARLEARDTAAKAAAKREEERIFDLKKIRGEKWLPALARLQGDRCRRR